MPNQQYVYLDAQAQPIYRVLRVNNDDGSKTFLQQRRTATGWANGLEGVPYVLYHLPVVLESSEVWLVEGEKCADALMGINLTATTKSGGAGRGWTEQEITALQGRHVIICPDNDGPGTKYWQNAVRHLVGVAASIRLLELDGLGEGEDVHDWLERGGTRETLVSLASEARQVGLEDLPAAQKPAPSHGPDDYRQPVDAPHTIDDIRACLDLITVSDRDEAVAVMLSIKHAGGSLSDFLAWRKRQPIGNGTFDLVKARNNWKAAKPAGGANFGKLVALAKQADPTFVTPGFLAELEHRAMQGMLGEFETPPWEEEGEKTPQPRQHINGHATRQRLAEAKSAASAIDVREVFDPWREVHAPVFPLDLVPPVVSDFIVARSTETGACMSSVAMSCLAVASGAITHEATLYLKPNQHFPVSPRLWVVLVGDPSAKKSPAISGAMKALTKWQSAVQAEAMRQWEEEVRDLPIKERKEYPKPKLTHFVVDDLTPEALADILSRQDRGTLVHADELAGWIGSLDRYGSGKGGGSSGRGIWLQAYNGGEYNLHRVSRSTVPVRNLSVSILGGIQPDRLRDLGNLTSDGLLQRFLPVMMRKSRIDSDTFDTRAAQEWEMFIRDLADYGAFSTELTPEAARERRRMGEFLHGLQQAESEGDAWKGFTGKMTGVWGNLALLLHILWGHPAGSPVTLETAQRASQLLEDFVLPHGLAFYQSVAGKAVGDNRAIGAFIANFNKPIITARDFVRGPACFRNGSTDDVAAKVGPFVAGGWLTPATSGPWNNSWKITQGLKDRFGNEVETHNAMVARIRSKFSEKDEQ